jgi:glutaminase
LRFTGKVADYIPELAKVPADRFAMAVHTVDGRRYQTGQADERFSIQSISKLFTLVRAYATQGEALWKRVGREPSGTPFNSLVQLEFEQGIPRNPFLNSGALVVTDILCSHYAHPTLAILDFLRDVSGAPDVNFDSAVAQSEAEHGFRNAATAFLIKNFGNLDSAPQAVLTAYFEHCAIEMSCAEVAAATLFAANHGTDPGSGRQWLTPQQMRRINSIALTCGTYDAAGDFAYRIGLPTKSGVGGGIVAIVPGLMTLCVWSPGLDRHGNSVAGAAALEHFTSLTGHSIF